MLNHQPLDLVFQALADPSRRTMVERLSRGPASVSDLAQPLDMSLPAVMQHLQVLEASGLVRSEKTGRVRTCRIDPKALGGVWDHSDVHEDMLGRLRRTARFIAVTTYGHRDKAGSAIARVR